MLYSVLLLFFNAPLSFQTIQAAFYCEDILPNIYLKDPSTGWKNIGSGASQNGQIQIFLQI